MGGEGRQFLFASGRNFLSPRPQKDEWDLAISGPPRGEGGRRNKALYYYYSRTTTPFIRQSARLDLVCGLSRLSRSLWYARKLPIGCAKAQISSWMSLNFSATNGERVRKSAAHFPHFFWGGGVHEKRVTQEGSGAYFSHVTTRLTHPRVKWRIFCVSCHARAPHASYMRKTCVMRQEDPSSLSLFCSSPPSPLLLFSLPSSTRRKWNIHLHERLCKNS